MPSAMRPRWPGPECRANLAAMLPALIVLAAAVAARALGLA
jgi:hypothetical protein